MSASSVYDAAVAILLQEKRALSPLDICNIAILKGLYSTQGKTPQNTFSSIITQHINKFGSESPFCRVSNGMYIHQDHRALHKETEPTKRIRGPARLHKAKSAPERETTVCVIPTRSSGSKFLRKRSISQVTRDGDDHQSPSQSRKLLDSPSQPISPQHEETLDSCASSPRFSPTTRSATIQAPQPESSTTTRQINPPEFPHINSILPIDFSWCPVPDLPTPKITAAAQPATVEASHDMLASPHDTSFYTEPHQPFNFDEIMDIAPLPMKQQVNTSALCSNVRKFSLVAFDGEDCAFLQFPESGNGDFMDSSSSQCVSPHLSLHEDSKSSSCENLELLLQDSLFSPHAMFRELFGHFDEMNR